MQGKPRIGRDPRRRDLYLDTSAIVKLAKDESESVDLLTFVLGVGRLMSSEVAVTEVPRALYRPEVGPPTFDLGASLWKAGIILERLKLCPISHSALRRAGHFPERKLRALDAIHVVTALDLRPIGAFVTYDKRQARAARRSGLPTVSPGW